MKEKLVLSMILLLSVSLCGLAAVSPGKTSQKTSQKAPKYGLIFKANALGNAGLLFNLSEKVSLRTTLGFGTRKDDSQHDGSHPFYGTDTVSELETGVALLYHIQKTRKHSVYLGMEVGMQYYHGKSSITYTGVMSSSQLTINQKYEQFGYHLDALVGVRHALSQKLAVYGEVSFGMTHRNVGDSDNDIMLWNLKRSGVGIIFYL